MKPPGSKQGAAKPLPPRRLLAATCFSCCALILMMKTASTVPVWGTPARAFTVPTAAAPPPPPAMHAVEPLHGLQYKSGHLNRTLMHHSYMEACEATRQAWVKRAKLAGSDAPPEPHPPSCQRCIVYGNEQYKVLYVRHPKTASSAVLDYFDRSSYGPGFLSELLTNTSRHSYAASLGEGQAVRMWADYFVFSVVRDPMERAASAYRFLMEFIQGEAAAAQLDWDAFCANPLSIPHFCASHRKQCHVGPLFQLIHVMEQAQCMMAEGGGLAVDFVAHNERLAEDLAQVVAHINARREPGLPDLVAPSSSSREINTSTAREQCIAEGGEVPARHQPANFTRLGPPMPGLLVKERYCSTRQFYEGRHAHCRASIAAYYRSDLELLYGRAWGAGWPA